MEAKDSDLGMTPQRIQSLADGIFAFSMTLLVITLDLPGAAKHLTTVGIEDLLMGQMDKFFNYALSFILLANFWIIHHVHFHYVQRTDRVHLWINIFTLMFVTLMPFSTSLVGAYGRERVAEIFFHANIFLLGILFYMNWIYATSGHRLIKSHVEPARIVLGRRRALSIPLFAVLAAVASFLVPSYSTLVYLFIPISLALMKK